LVDIEAAGYTAADQEWQDAYQQVVELEKAVQDNDIAMAEWEKTIRDMDFEKFDRFIGRLDDVKSEIDNVRGLFEDDDVANKDGTWTEEGITSLGLAYQQMELAQQKSQEYAEKIEDLNEAYKNGEMSEKEYYERLQELKDGQWGAIDAYEAAKDAIIDMEEARIDMIEEGIEEEIDAYSELIDMKKSELEAERD
jgi:chromosome segregation ATPase